MVKIALFVTARTTPAPDGPRFLGWQTEQYRPESLIPGV
jgi:hypothetical protein